VDFSAAFYLIPMPSFADVFPVRASYSCPTWSLSHKGAWPQCLVFSPQPLLALYTTSIKWVFFYYVMNIYILLNLVFYAFFINVFFKEYIFSVRLV